jgi:hypothetical protein
METGFQNGLLPHAPSSRAGENGAQANMLEDDARIQVREFLQTDPNELRRLLVFFAESVGMKDAKQTPCGSTSARQRARAATMERFA